MIKRFTILTGLALALMMPFTSTAADTEILLRRGGEAKILGSGFFNFNCGHVGNTSTNTILDLGKYDLSKFKAVGIEFANGWNGNGTATVKVGNNPADATAVCAIVTKTTPGYDAYKNFIGIVNNAPAGEQNVFVTFEGACGNINRVYLYENVPTNVKQQEDANYVAFPNEANGYYDAAIKLLSTNSVGYSEEAPTENGPRFDGTQWGWTHDGFIADYGTVDFGEGKYKQVVTGFKVDAEGRDNYYLEVYVDEPTAENLVAKIWAGRNYSGGVYPVAKSIDAISGSHKVFVKWLGGSINLEYVEFTENTVWTEADEYATLTVPENTYDTPSEGAFVNTFSGQPEGQCNPWAYTVLNRGRYESGGNIGFTGNGTVIRFKDVDFGEKAYDHIIFNYATDNNNDNYALMEDSYFAVYLDLEKDGEITDWTKPWITTYGVEPIAILDMQNSGGWGNKIMNGADLTCEIDGVHDMYIVYNNRRHNDSGANIFDIYLERRVPYVAPLTHMPLVATIPTTHDNCDNVKIIDGGWFNREPACIGNTDAGKILVDLGEVDFGEAGAVKAIGVDFANGWGDGLGYTIIKAGETAETAEVIAEIATKPNGSYAQATTYVANLTKELSGKQHLFLSARDNTGNYFAVRLFGSEIIEAATATNAEATYLTVPAEEVVEVMSKDSQAINPEQFPEAAMTGADNSEWGWTGDGFIADYGTFDFGTEEYVQAYAFFNHWSNNLNDKIEIYFDEVTPENLVTTIFAGLESRDRNRPFAATLDTPVTGSHKVLVKWIGGSINVYKIGFSKNVILPETPMHDLVEFAAKEADAATPKAEDLMFTFRNNTWNNDTQIGVGNPYEFEILNRGQREGNNVGFTGDGTILRVNDVDFGAASEKTLYLTYATGNNDWYGYGDVCNFKIYIDLESDNWADKAASIGDNEPIATIRRHSTGGWGNDYTTGGTMTPVEGIHDMYIVFNNPRNTGEGANIKDIYCEGFVSGISEILSGNEDAIVNVYSVLGTLVRSNVKASEATQGLAAGIYIVGNEKVVVK